MENSRLDIRPKQHRKYYFCTTMVLKRQEVPDIRSNVDSLPNNIAATMARTSMIERVKANKCEWCKKENVEIEMHHVRKLKDLKGKKSWEKRL